MRSRYSYAQNNSKSMSSQTPALTQLIFVDKYGSPVDMSCENRNPTLLTGSEASGAVYINPEYNAEKLSPGISWTL